MASNCRKVAMVLTACVSVMCVLAMSGVFESHNFSGNLVEADNIVETRNVFSSHSASKEPNVSSPSVSETLRIPTRCNLTSSAERLTTLYKWCAENSINYNLTSKRNINKNMKEIYVSEKYKVMYCHIPKTGCTNWKKYFILLSGRTSYTALRQIRGSDAHDKLFTDNVKSLSQFSDADKSKMLKTYFKFVFVRHPLTRLLSAYRNKFEKINPTFEWFRQKILVYNNLDPTSKSQLTFTHFLQYLTDPEGVNMHYNGHWQNYHEMCHPCRIKYDYIGQVETMTEDVKHILKRIGAPYSFPERQSSSDQYVTDYYRAVSNSLTRRVIHKYSDDFAPFGYNC